MKRFQRQLMRALPETWRSGLACLLLLPAPLLAEEPMRSRTFAAGSVPHFMVFSPDGRMLASAADGEKDGPSELTLWDVASGKTITIFKGHTGMIAGAAFSPNGETLATAGGRLNNETGPGRNPGAGELLLWDVATRRISLTFKPGPGFIRCVVFSPDGRTLASFGETAADVWDVATGKKTATLETDAPPSPFALTCLAFSPDGKKLAVGGSHARRPDGGVTGQIQLWDLSTGQRTAVLIGHPGEGCFSNMFAAAFSLAFSDDGKTLVSGGARTVELWDVATAKNVMMAPGAGVVWRVAFGPDSRSVFAVCEIPRPGGDVKRPTQGEVRLVEVPSGKQLASLRSEDQIVWCVAISPDRRNLAFAAEDGGIKLWNVSSLFAR